MFHLKSYLSAKRGRQIELARTLGIKPCAVSQWKRVPAERVLDVERATGVSRHDLRPDIYPVEDIPKTRQYHADK